MRKIMHWHEADTIPDTYDWHFLQLAIEKSFLVFFTLNFKKSWKWQLDMRTLSMVLSKFDFLQE